MDTESRVQHQSLAEPRSESKVLVGQKMDIMEAEETSDNSHKRLKLHDSDSSNHSKAEGVQGCNNVHLNVSSGAIDLNVNVGPVSVMGGLDDPACIASAKEARNRRLDLDLNAEDTSSSINNDPFYPFKNYENLKSRDDSECGSSMGPLDGNDPLRVWKGLKKNHYITASYGPVPMPMQKTRGRKKNNNDSMRKKIELAKKEQVDRFAKVAAPSGLLNGLNPGIINHVRNRKQVHSIIEALVRSENTERKHSGSRQGDQINSGAGECTEREEHGEMQTSGVNRFGLSHGDYALFAESNYLNSEVTRGGDDSYMGETRIFERMPSQFNIETKDDGLTLKLSSSVTVASENASCLSNEESGNFTSVTSLSLKAANVASQWLELLNQDIKGRLAALRRSKKRVRTVITTDLPLLISREFSPNLCYPEKASADAHAARWSTLFEQMDKALSEEESHLENWLNQVKEMQLHCESGLYNSFYNDSHNTGPSGNNIRLGEAHNSEKDLAVGAAAASIYSTCNFLLTMGNLPSC